MMIRWAETETPTRFNSTFFHWQNVSYLFTLVVQEATHAHTLDSPAVSQKGALVVQDLLHIHGLDAANVSTVYTLSNVGDLTHAHSLDNIVVIPSQGQASLWNMDFVQREAIYWKYINRAQFHGFLIWQIAMPTAGAPPVTLSVAELAHAHTVEAFAITQKHALTVADLGHTQTLDATILTQAHTLAIQALLHAHTLDSPLVQTPAQLIIQELLHAHSLDDYALTQKHYLDVTASTGIEVADIAVLDGEDAGTTPWEFDSLVEEAGNSFELSADAALHGDNGYKVSFGGTNDVAYGISPIFSSQTEIYYRTYFYFPSGYYPFRTEGTPKELYVCYTRGTGDGGTFVAYVKLKSSNASIYVDTFYYATDVGVSNIGGIATEISRDAEHYLEIRYKAGDGDGVAGLLLDGVSIAAATALSNDSMRCTYIQQGVMYSANNPANGEYFYIDDILISTTGLIGAYRGAASEDLSLTHAHSADNVALTLAVYLVVNDLSHTQTVDNVALTQAHVLVVDDAGHAHRLENLLLPQKHLLALQDLLHAHNLERVVFTTVHGYVTVSFTGKRAEITYVGKAADVDFEGKRPDVDIS